MPKDSQLDDEDPAALREEALVRAAEADHPHVSLCRSDHLLTVDFRTSRKTYLLATGLAAFLGLELILTLLYSDDFVPALILFIMIAVIPFALIARTSLAISPAGVRIERRVGPIRRVRNIASSEIVAIRIERFHVSYMWDLHVAVITKQRNFRVGWSLSEASADEIKFAVKDLLHTDS